MKYGFIGCGNMGGAIARALSRSTKDILISDRSGRAETLAEELGIGYGSVEQVVVSCDRIFLAVKPHMVREVLEPFQAILNERRPILISMAAGLEISTIQKLAGTRLPVIRFMPKTPVAVG